MRDNLLGDPNRGDDVTPELAQLASERALKQGSQGMLQGEAVRLPTGVPTATVGKTPIIINAHNVVFTCGVVCIFTVAFRGRDLVLVLAAGFVQLLSVV